MDLTKLENRLKLIQDINSTQNKARKYESLRQTEIFNDRIFNHVFERLVRRNNIKTNYEMPIVSSINLCKRIATKEASIYRDSAPNREFSELSDDQDKKVNLIYNDMSIDAKMLHSNESFKLQNQNHVMIVPINGKLKMRVLRNHHLDSIDDPINPDMPIGYVISQIDKNEVLRNNQSLNGGSGNRGLIDGYTNNQSDFTDQLIGDSDDFKKRLDRYVVWTKELNFIMNGKGEIISGDEITNNLGIIPIVDISVEKDFEYWVRQGDSLTDFTTEFNVLLSDTSQVVRMQGYSQAYLIAKDDLVPENFQVGPNFLLKLAVEEGSNVRPEFGFSNPGADLAGSINFAQVLLSMFLTSKGLEPSTVSGQGQSDNPTSGFDRLLQMIDSFSASKADFAIYEKAESEIYNIIKAYHNMAIGTDLLDKKYVASKISDNSEISVKFAGPELIQSLSEKISNWKLRIESGESTVIDMIMDLRNVTKEDAVQIYKDNIDVEREIIKQQQSLMPQEPKDQMEDQTEEPMEGEEDGNRVAEPTSDEDDQA